MNVRNFSLVLALVAISASSAFAQGQYDFFWSFSDTGATNGDVSMDFAAGETGSLFMYYSTNGPADSDLSVGAFLDIATSMSGVVEFTSATTFDFDLLVGGQDSGLNRLLNAMGEGGSAGDTGTLTSDFVDEWNAFTVNGGPGIVEANNGSGVFLDAGYDAGADAFLWGEIGFTVLGDPGGDSTDILSSAGDGQIVNGADIVKATFGNATINVTGGPVIPEPTTAGLLALGLVGLVARRRR